MGMQLFLHVKKNFFFVPFLNIILILNDFKQCYILFKQTFLAQSKQE